MSDFKNIQLSFFGEPHKVKVKGDNGEDVEFVFRQLGALDMIDFQKVINLKSKVGRIVLDKEGNLRSEDSIPEADLDRALELDAEASKLLYPFVLKAVKEAGGVLEGVSDEQAKVFVDNNFGWLKDEVYLLNTSTLRSQMFTGRDALNEFIEKEKKKIG